MISVSTITPPSAVMISFAKRLITEAKVAVVPGTAFYYQAKELGQHLVRFAFAKTSQVLHEAGENLSKTFYRR